MDQSNQLKSRRWIIWSLVLPIATLLVSAAIMSIPPRTGNIDIVAGEKLYTTHCAWCHSTRVDYPAFKAPNLHDIGRTAATRKPNQSAADYLLESILEPDAFLAPSSRPGMPRNIVADLSPKEIRDLVGYLASLGAFPEYEAIARLEVPDLRVEKEATLVRLEDIQMAEHVLRDKGSCLKCHSLYHVPEGKIFAPGLFGSGLTDPMAIRESLIDPQKQINAHYASITVLLTNGQLVSGQLVSRDDDRMVVCVRDEQNQLNLREIPLDEIETENGQPLVTDSKVSLMPQGFDETLTGDEINAVITLIRLLN